MSIADPGLDNAQGGDPGAPFDIVPGRDPVGWMVFASPHSGVARPADMNHAAGLSVRTLRSAEDVGVDALIASAPIRGVPTIASRVSRAYVDLNRAPDELDPALIDGCDSSDLSAKVAAGFGVVPRRAGDGTVLYDRRLGLEEARSRLDRVHRPYHEALAGLLALAHRRHGRALLVDWHSMPSHAAGKGARGARGTDVILGDRHGAACSPRISRRFRALFEAEGWRVGLNAPYAGGYATQTWGRPAEGFEAIQIEINRALYLDEGTLKPSPDHSRFEAALGRVIAGMAAEPPPK